MSTKKAGRKIIVRSSKGTRRRITVAELRLHVGFHGRLGTEKDDFYWVLTERKPRPADCPPEQFPRSQDQAYLMRRFFRTLKPVSASRLLAAVSHPQRIAILKILLCGPACYRLLTKTTGLKAGPLYHHLGELRSAGLVGPKTRDIYSITRKGKRAMLLILALTRLT